MKNLTIITLFLIIWSPAFASEAPSLEVECDQMVKDNSNHDLAYEMQTAVIINQDLAKITDILDRGFDINAPIGCGTFCAVDGALSNGNGEMLKFLIAKGATPPERTVVNASSKANPTLAYQLVSILLDAGISPNAKNYYNSKRYSVALHKAAWRGHEKVVQLLLSQPNIELNHFNVDGQTPLMSAISKNHLNVATILMEKGADVHIISPRGQLRGLTAKGILLKRIEEKNNLLRLLESKTEDP